MTLKTPVASKEQQEGQGAVDTAAGSDDGEDEPLIERGVGISRSHSMLPRPPTASSSRSRPVVVAVVLSCLLVLVLLGLSAALQLFPFSSHSPFPSPSSPGLPSDWVPGGQPRLHDRLGWLEDVLPLAELQALRQSPDDQLASSEAAPSNSQTAALRAFFEHYTRFHARSMRSLGPETKFLISRARGYYEQGMGNRLLAVVSAFLLAALTDRVFIVDWSRHPEDQFDLEDVFDSPPINWSVSQLERHYGKEVILEAEGQVANHITLTQQFDSDRATYEALLCGSLERWHASNGSAQVLLVDSNQFFAPLLWHNPRMRTRLEAWGFSNGQLGVWVLRYLFHPVAAVREQMNEMKAQHWRPYMIGVQLRTRDGHATSESITALAYRCALLLTDALPLSWKLNGEVGWFLATDNEDTRAVGTAILANYSQSTGLPAPDLVYASCTDALGGSQAVSRMRCALLHMALLGEVDDVVLSKKSTFGDIGHVTSGLAPMVLTSQQTCVRQPVADPCFHHWHHVRKLECFAAATIRSASLEDVNGRCSGDGLNWPT